MCTKSFLKSMSSNSDHSGCPTCGLLITSLTNYVDPDKISPLSLQFVAVQGSTLSREYLVIIRDNFY